MKHLIGKVVIKEVDFMGEKVEVRKLSINQVRQIQELVKKANKSNKEENQLDLIGDVIKIAVVGAEELTKEDFNGFPIGELNDLVNTILELSGLGAKEAGN